MATAKLGSPPCKLGSTRRFCNPKPYDSKPLGAHLGALKTKAGWVPTRVLESSEMIRLKFGFYFWILEIMALAEQAVSTWGTSHAGFRITGLAVSDPLLFFTRGLNGNPTTPKRLRS